MNALENIIAAISRQDTSCKIAVSETNIIPIEGEDAHLVIFDYLDREDGTILGRTAAVVYGDETCFSRDDWQDGQYPAAPEEIADYEWLDHESGRHAVMLNGLPRVF